MTKSCDDFLLDVALAILMDCKHLYASDLREWDRDRKRLVLLSETRGSKVFTLDFPAAAKALDRAFATGLLDMTGRPCMGGKSSSPLIPRLFGGLWLRVFHYDGSLLNEPCISSIAALRQLLQFSKKLKADCGQKATCIAAEDFYELDQSLDPPSDFWDDPTHLDLSVNLSDDREIRHHDCSSDLLRIAQKVADIVVSSFPEFNPYDWRFKHGPGAVSDARTGSYKYDFPGWPQNLEAVFPFADFAFANFGAWTDFVKKPIDEQPYDCSSKLIAVPKTQKGPRLIASEPTASQWCQQSILDFLVQNVSQTPIASSVSFSEQELNAKAALAASHSGDHATIDLSSASDCVSCWLVERVWRKNPSILLAFQSVRTPFIRNSISNRIPSRWKLKKFSTMGSAVTFPQQTVLYAILAVACVLYSQNTMPSANSIRLAAKDVQVFGDDIVIPTNAADKMVGILTYLGFRINTDKTFLTGKFRESCGVDAYDGHDVTATFVRQIPSATRPDSVVSTVESSNNLYLRGWWYASSVVTEAVGRKVREYLPVVATGSGTFGLVSFLGQDLSHLRERWSDTLHRTEHLCLVPNSGASVEKIEGNSPLLQYFSEKPYASSYGRLGVVSTPSWESGRRNHRSLYLRKRWGFIPA